MAYTKIAKWLGLGLFLTTMGLLGWLYVRDYRLSVVQTSSMMPTIHKGSLVIARPVGAVQPGNIGLYINDMGQTIIHRLLYVSSSGSYVFKGDANTLVDAPVNKQQVIGQPKVIVPYIGYAALFMKSWTGIVLFIYIPAIAILAYEVNRLAFQLSTAKDKSFRRSEYRS